MYLIQIEEVLESAPQIGAFQEEHNFLWLVGRYPVVNVLVREKRELTDPHVRKSDALLDIYLWFVFVKFTLFLNRIVWWLCRELSWGIPLDHRASFKETLHHHVNLKKRKNKTINEVEARRIPSLSLCFVSGLLA